MKGALALYSLLVFAPVVFAPVVFAAESILPRASLSLGTGAVFEKNNDARTDDLRLPLMFGAGGVLTLQSGALYGQFEYSRFSTKDGNETVSVRRLEESLFVWSGYEIGRSAHGFNPYLGGGVGVARGQTETSLFESGVAVQEQSTGAWSPRLGVQAGLLAQWSRDFRLRSEARYEMPWTREQGFKMGDARFGIVFTLQYLFGERVKQ